MTDSLPIGKLATRWLQQDRDPDTRREIEALIAADDGTELERRLRKRIAFGTAGLRSSMKAGYAHMNSLTVLQASQGLADYILAQRQLQGTSGRPTVVIGYDARHNSQKFARLAAGAFLAKGFGVLWFGILVHTPMVPFAVSHFALRQASWSRLLIILQPITATRSTGEMAVRSYRHMTRALLWRLPT